MGSVTAFILVPFLSVFVLIGTIIGAITGSDKTKIELPYDKEQGLVWTSKETADWFSVTDVEIKNDKQIFTVKGECVFSNEYRRDYELEEVIFTAENNEQVVYIAEKYEGVRALNINHIVTVYSLEEYGAITYTPKADSPVDGAVWYSRSDENIYKTEGADGEAAFKLVYLPGETDGYTVTTHLIYAIKGEYGIHDYRERILLNVELKNGEASIIKKPVNIMTAKNGQKPSLKQSNIYESSDQHRTIHRKSFTLFPLFFIDSDKTRLYGYRKYCDIRTASFIHFSR